MCPQMLIGGEVGYYCDIFSFGVVMQEVIALLSLLQMGAAASQHVAAPAAPALLDKVVHPERLLQVITGEMAEGRKPLRPPRCMHAASQCISIMQGSAEKNGAGTVGCVADVLQLLRNRGL